jgi:hypothetical protein
VRRPVTVSAPHRRLPHSILSGFEEEGFRREDGTAVADEAR